jgi:Recombination endonuclease VII
MQKQETNNILNMFPEKVCNTCKKLLPLEAYSNRKSFKDGKENKCRSCRYAYNKQHRKNNPDKTKVYRKKSNLWASYKITLDQYNIFLESQNYKCAICKIHVDQVGGRHGTLNVDHCHNTGKIRGLLCSNCNTGLGQFKDNTNRLKSAISYLKLHC